MLNKIEQINLIMESNELDELNELKEYYLNLSLLDCDDFDNMIDNCDNMINNYNDYNNDVDGVDLIDEKVQAKPKIIYENKELYSKNGELIGFIPEKRFNWYIKKGLCDVIDANSAMLNFEPTYKNQKVVIDKNKQSAKQNICVVCGCTENLKRFRVIPYEIKKYFPENYKAHISSDVVVICQNLSSYGDMINNKMKLQLFEEYGVDINLFKIESTKKHIYMILKKIQKNNYKIDNPYIKKSLFKYFGKDLSTEDIINFLNQIDNFKYNGFSTPEEMLVSNIVKANKMTEFIKKWKENFYNIMQPKYLQWDYWS